MITKTILAVQKYKEMDIDKLQIHIREKIQQLIDNKSEDKKL